MSEEETAWATGLSEENRLYLLELLEDMLGELELGTSRPAIKLWNQVIKYPQLHPGDGIQIRQNYMKRRYQMAQLLEQHGIVSNVDVPRGQSGYDVDLLFQGDPAHVRALLASVRASFPRRTKPPSPPSPPFWKRYASEAFSLAIGVAITLAIIRWSWGYAVLAVLPIVGLLRALRILPSWSGAWKGIVDVATVLGAAAALVQLILDSAKQGR